MSYPIEGYWTRAFKASKSPDGEMIAGWSGVDAPFAGFQEASLTLDDELSTAGADDADIILISAPGAVGKSTFAKQLCFRTNSLLVDLAKAEPVGANTISGGLARCDLYNEWRSGSLGIVIDGVDEARIRVTQEAFEAFLADIKNLSENKPLPTVVLGRTGAIQDSWIWLEGEKAKIAVMELGFFDRETSIEFAKSQLRVLKKDSAHVQVEDTAVELLIDRIRAETEADSDRFAGYAPVLNAISQRVAREENPSTLISEVERGEQPITLRTIVDYILERERGKLESLPFEDKSLAKKLYTPPEQLGHLSARVYGSRSPQIEGLSPTDFEIYSSALNTWIDEHPFLSGSEPSSAVFGAFIAAHDMFARGEDAPAITTELEKGAKANPFLAEFYFENLKDLTEQAQGSEVSLMPASHVGVVYASIRAGLALGDKATLTVYGTEIDDEERLLEGDVEISVSRKMAAEPQIFQFIIEETNVIRLGPYIEDVDIQSPLVDVEIGSGREALLVAPISLQCRKLISPSQIWIIERARDGEGAVVLEADELEAPSISRVPSLRGDVALTVSWEDSSAHPWTTFSAPKRAADDPRVDEGLRRFRKFVISFRSHSKGSLRRYRRKLDHERMTKGTGKAILERLVHDGIISIDGAMYVLHPDVLGDRTNSTYSEIYRKTFSKESVEYISNALP
ncbi:hypothetical protein [Alteriqipengyuania lutimaris]|nr:hypothetical protein [Alteriqipengyuania lutimaris]MBB3035262.1 hypothetical protein [Alteriqipengyuania lutimaris]